MFERIGPMELGIIVFLVLMIFGVGKLPQVGASLGRGLREFREGIAGTDEAEEKKGLLVSPTTGSGDDSQPRS